MTIQQQPRYITGHGLQHEGAAHDAAGNRRGRVGREGRGKCACGVLSEPLPSKSARQRWHKEHKAEVLAALQETPAPAPVVVVPEPEWMSNPCSCECPAGAAYGVEPASEWGCPQHGAEANAWRAGRDDTLKAMR